MSISRDDMKRLRTPIALCLVLIAAGIGSLVAADQAMTRALKNKDIVRQAKTAAQEKVAKATEEEREIRENLIDFQKLVDWGILGEEKRLDWVENITRIRAQRKLFQIGYDIEAQRPLEYPGVMPAAGMEFRASRMKIDMQLLHEEDLLNFLSDFQSSGKAYVAVRKCGVERTERTATPGGRGMTPRLKADCQLDMITVREKSTP